MKKFFYFLFVLGILYACSTDSLENDLLLTADAKPNLNSEEDGIPEAFNYDPLCAGIASDFCMTFPQASAGPNDKDTQVQVQQYVYGEDPESNEDDGYEQIFKGEGATEVCSTWTFEEAGIYDIRYKIGSGGFTDLSIEVIDCNECEESFSYDELEGNLYTFYYTPAEDIDDALLVFTFAQSVEVSGLDGWEQNGQTEQLTMDLEKCETYEWTIGLEALCRGNSPNSNVWTDFKVNDVSKKNENTPNLTQECN